MKTKQVLNNSIHDIDMLLKYLYLGHSVTVPGYIEGTQFRFSMPDDDLSIRIEFRPNLGTGKEEFSISHDSDSLLTPQGLADIIDLLKEMPAENKRAGKNRFEEIKFIAAAEATLNM